MLARPECLLALPANASTVHGPCCAQVQASIAEGEQRRSAQAGALSQQHEQLEGLASSVKAACMQRDEAVAEASEARSELLRTVKELGALHQVGHALVCARVRCWRRRGHPDQGWLRLWVVTAYPWGTTMQPRPPGQAMGLTAPMHHGT